MKTKIDVLLFHFVFFIIIGALCFCYNGIDNDLFSRLIQGSAVVNLHHPLYNDVFSYSPVNIWVDHEWLTSALMYLALMKSGFLGLVILKTFFIYLSFLSLVFVVLKLNKQESPYNFLIWLLLLLHLVNFKLIYSTLKVQWISFIILPLWILCLEKIKLNDKKYVLIMPLLALFWLNCHAGIISGVGIMVIYVLDFIIKKRPLKPILIAFVLVLLMFLFNPWGIKYVSFLFNAINYDKSMMSEWMNIFNPKIAVLNLSIYKSFILLAFIWIIYKIKNQKKEEIDYSKIITLSIVLILSIVHIKHIQLFMIIFIIYCYEDFYKFLNYLLSKILKKYYKIVTQNAKYIAYIILLVCSIVLLNKSDYKKMVWLDSREYFPVDCINFILQNDIKARVLAPFSVSDYIAYKGYPNIKIFMNSRYEQLYPEEYLKISCDFFNLNSARPMEILFKYPPDIIITENYRPIAVNSNILYELGYSLIYQDNYYSAFVINSKRNFSYFYPKPLDESYFDHIFDTKFLN